MYSSEKRKLSKIWEENKANDTTIWQAEKTIDEIKNELDKVVPNKYSINRVISQYSSWQYPEYKEADQINGEKYYSEWEFKFDKLDISFVPMIKFIVECHKEIGYEKEGWTEGINSSSNTGVSTIQVEQNEDYWNITVRIGWWITNNISSVALNYKNLSNTYSTSFLNNTEFTLDHSSDIPLPFIAIGEFYYYYSYNNDKDITIKKYDSTYTLVAEDIFSPSLVTGLVLQYLGTKFDNNYLYFCFYKTDNYIDETSGYVQLFPSHLYICKINLNFDNEELTESEIFIENFIELNSYYNLLATYLDWNCYRGMENISLVQHNLNIKDNKLYFLRHASLHTDYIVEDSITFNMNMCGCLLLSIDYDSLEIIEEKEIQPYTEIENYWEWIDLGHIKLHYYESSSIPFEDSTHQIISFCKVGNNYIALAQQDDEVPYFAFLKYDTQWNFLDYKTSNGFTNILYAISPVSFGDNILYETTIPTKLNLINITDIFNYINTDINSLIQTVNYPADFNNSQFHYRMTWTVKEGTSTEEINIVDQTYKFRVNLKLINENLYK